MFDFPLFKAEDVHVPVDWCDFIVAYDHQDTGFASLRSESEIEVISCERLLNLDKSSPGWRSFYVPLQVTSHHYHFSDYCVLRLWRD